MLGIDDDDAIFEAVVEERERLDLLHQGPGAVDDDKRGRVGLLQESGDQRAERLRLAVAASRDKHGVFKQARGRDLERNVRVEQGRERSAFQIGVHDFARRAFEVRGEFVSCGLLVVQNLFPNVFESRARWRSRRRRKP